MVSLCPLLSSFPLLFFFCSSETPRVFSGDAGPVFLGLSHLFCPCRSSSCCNAASEGFGCFPQRFSALVPRGLSAQGGSCKTRSAQGVNLKGKDCSSPESCLRPSPPAQKLRGFQLSGLGGAAAADLGSQGLLWQLCSELPLG